MNDFDVPNGSIVLKWLVDYIFNKQELFTVLYYNRDDIRVSDNADDFKFLTKSESNVLTRIYLSFVLLKSGGR